MDRENTDWDKLYKHYDAAVDWPTVNFYKVLLARYPNIKVVLTVRSADSWYKSIKNTVHSAFVGRINTPKDHPMYPIRRMFLAVGFDGIFADPVRFKDEEKVKQMFLDHIEDVKKNVPADQLLVMELGEGWERLCKFLDKEVPEESYPSVNSTEEFRKTVSEKTDINFMPLTQEDIKASN
jgi:hypothetical protein